MPYQLIVLSSFALCFHATIEMRCQYERLRWMGRMPTIWDRLVLCHVCVCVSMCVCCRLTHWYRQGHSTWNHFELHFQHYGHLICIIFFTLIIIIFHIYFYNDQVLFKMSPRLAYLMSLRCKRINQFVESINHILVQKYMHKYWSVKLHKICQNGSKCDGIQQEFVFATSLIRAIRGARCFASSSGDRHNWQLEAHPCLCGWV